MSQPNKSLKLSLALSSLFLLPFSNAHADLNDGLVAHWSFDDCKATDNSGNGHDGTINGNPQCVDGVKGKAFSFNATGASDYIDLGTSIPSYNNFTITGWINISRFADYVGTNRDGTIFARGTTSTDASLSYNLYVRHAETLNYLRSDIGVGGSIGGYDSIGTKSEPKTNTWIFVVTTYDGKQLSIFQDSKLISSKQTSLIPQGGNLQSSIGKSLNETYWNYDNSYGFTGLIDDLRIYNRALTEAEVLELYEGKEKVASSIDLSLALTAPTSVKTAEKATYQLTATNNGNAPATGVKAHFVVPRKSIATVDIPKNCTLNGRIIECALSDLDANQSATQTFSMTALRKGALSVVGLVNSDKDDANYDDNKKSAVVLLVK